MFIVYKLVSIVVDGSDSLRVLTGSHGTVSALVSAAVQTFVDAF